MIKDDKVSRNVVYLTWIRYHMKFCSEEPKGRFHLAGPGIMDNIKMDLSDTAWKGKMDSSKSHNWG
jgi:hypothetical protein